ncbi:MAG: ThuA domain-containing protein [Clostridia bacterium]|nr:ThuA domain-containing protein [Clostridia bacterium]
MSKIRVTVWNEYRHERKEPRVAEIYPKGIHGAIADILSECDDVEVRTATLDEPEHGLTDEVLNTTDVLIWWGHLAHGAVSDDVVEKIKERVYRHGMGFFAVHSGHHSKPFRAIVGTTGDLTWGRDQKEIVWNILPQHPIAKGLPGRFSLFEEMYGEPFAIPTPDELIFSSWYEDGNIFRSGCTFYRGVGKVVYFQPGHELCRSFYNENVRKVIQNAVHWLYNPLSEGVKDLACPHQTVSVLEQLAAEQA